MKTGDLGINIIYSNTLFALTPGDIQKKDVEVPGGITSTLTSVEKEIRVIGSIIAAGTLMVIGIKYMLIGTV